jgi:hypothetical protein
VFGIGFIATGRTTASWPSVEGSLVGPRVTWSGGVRDGGARQWYVELHYRYEVEGTAYRSRRFSLGDGTRATGLWGSEDEARATAREYRAGQPLTVYYDPGDPSSAVLEPGLSLGVFAPVIIGSMLTALAVWVLRRIRRQEAGSGGGVPPPVTP